jgi:ornithine carbamoyltransferase
MHCLPAYRGNEIGAEVMERFSEIIFAEAENRLHFQRSLLNVLLAEGGIA